MEKPEEKHCPRCNSAFICNVGDIVNCQCYGVEFDEASRSILSSTGFDCLCQNCLVETKSKANPNQ